MCFGASGPSGFVLPVTSRVVVLALARANARNVAMLLLRRSLESAVACAKRRGPNDIGW